MNPPDQTPAKKPTLPKSVPFLQWARLDPTIHRLWMANTPMDQIVCALAQEKVALIVELKKAYEAGYRPAPVVEKPATPISTPPAP